MRLITVVNMHQFPALRLSLCCAGKRARSAPGLISQQIRMEIDQFRGKQGVSEGDELAIFQLQALHQITVVMAEDLVELAIAGDDLHSLAEPPGQLRVLRVYVKHQWEWVIDEQGVVSLQLAHTGRAFPKHAFNLVCTEGNIIKLLVAQTRKQIIKRPLF